MSVIKVENISHTYSPGTPLAYTSLEDISLELHQGEYLALAGATGSGKSTLALHLNGLLIPARGRVLVEGQDTREKKVRSALWQTVGLLFQFPEKQFFEENVFKEIAFGPGNLKLEAGEILSRVKESLEAVGMELDEIKHLSPFDLSGGQKRRVALASILALRPRVLVLDEPTAGIDPAGRRGLMDRIKNLQNKSGMTVVLISHDMEEIARYADRLLVLDRGTVVAEGKTRDVFSRPAKLRGLSLDVPFAVDLAEKLSLCGKRLHQVPLTVDEAEIEVLRLFNKSPAVKK